MLIGIGNRIGRIGSKLKPYQEYFKRVLADGGAIYDSQSAIDLYDYLRTNNLLAAPLALPASSGKATKLYSLLPDTGAGDFDVLRLSKKHIINRNGFIEECDINVLKPNITSGIAGWLIENQKTNLITRSQELNLSPWISGEVSVTPNSGISPDGTNNAFLVKMLSGLTRLGYNNIPVSENQQYVLSFYAKNKTITVISTTISNTTSFESVAYTPQLIVDQWVRVVRTFTVASGASLINIQITRSGVIGEEILLWGVQLELGTIPTSYIKTGSATETRDADVCTVDLPAGVTKSTLIPVSGSPIIDNSPSDPYQIPVGNWKSIIME